MRYEKHYYVYILASLSGTLYIGITNNLERRMVEHKEGLVGGFTSTIWCPSAETNRDERKRRRGEAKNLHSGVRRTLRFVEQVEA